MDEQISLNHGSGGRIATNLINTLFARKFGMDIPLTDSALLKNPGLKIAFTTDSYVVNPIFFPGGDIGKLSVCGTINDLSVSGAIPMYISVSFIIEEGLPLTVLESIVNSMSDEAMKAGVKIITGDTKVVERNKCDKIFINTSGIGFLDPKYENISIAAEVSPGDKLIINGHLANHAIAILGSRENLSFETTVESDCASLNNLIQSVLKESDEIHFMRDLTRGGLATILNELSGIIKMGISIHEKSIPVEEPVRGICEVLGFDPLYLANEGKVLIVVGDNDAKKVINKLKSHPLGVYSEIIGEIEEDEACNVILNTSVGGKRILNQLSGIQLPRIC